MKRLVGTTHSLFLGALIYGLAGGGGSVRIQAQENGGKKGKDGALAWHAERAKLEEVINTRVEAELDKAVSKRDVVKGLNWRWPVKPPTKTKEEIVQIVEHGVNVSAEQKYPAAKRKEFQKEAEEKYRIYKEGEDISFTIRGGMGTHTNVSGKLYQISPTRIRVGSRWIVRRDMSEETCANFYKDMSKKFIERYVRVENNRYDAKIEGYKGDLRRERLPRSFSSNGYVPKKRSLARSLKPESWVAKSDVVDFFYRKLRAKAEPEIRRRVTEEVFASNGYVLVVDETNGSKEWMPKKEAESFRAKIARLLAEKKRKEEDAKAATEDPWGEPAEGEGKAEGEGMQMGGEGMPGMGPGMGPGMEGKGQGQGMPGMDAGMGPGMGPGMGEDMQQQKKQKKKKGGEQNPCDENQ